MDRSWLLFGRGLLLLGASWGSSGPRQASGIDVEAILEPLGAKIDDLENFSARRGGCFLTCYSRRFSCAGALEFVRFALGAKRPPKQIHRKKHCFNEFSMFAFLPGEPRGRHERLKKRSKTAFKKHHKNTEKLVFSRPRAKPPKKPNKKREKVMPGRPK